MSALASREVKWLSRAQLFATPWTVACPKLLHPWDFLGKSTGVGCRFLLQGLFPTQGSNPGLPHGRQMLYHLSHQEVPNILRGDQCYIRKEHGEVGPGGQGDEGEM